MLSLVAAVYKEAGEQELYLEKTVTLRGLPRNRHRSSNVPALSDSSARNSVPRSS